jgi:hypothetical protein
MTDAICSVDGCDKSASSPNTGRGLCVSHYTRLQRAGVFKSQRFDTCQVPDCDAAADLPVMGYCNKHYKRLKRHGDPMLGRPSGTAEQRFWQFVRKGATEDECWLWLGQLHHEGYAHLSVGGCQVPAHRFSYELHHGTPIPPGLQIDHLCRNRGCVNPRHLEPVTSRTNVLRGISPPAKNVIKTHCPQGHAYDESNTRWYQGRRYCRACADERKRVRRTAQRARGERVT